MKLRTVLALCSLLVFPSVPMAAQTFGTLIDRGLGFDVGHSQGDGQTQVSLSGGYVFSELSEVALQAFIINVDDADVTIWGGGPSIGVHPIRQRDQVPISVRLGASFSLFEFIGDDVDDLAFDDIEFDASGSLLLLTASLYRHAAVTRHLAVVPFATIGYGRQKNSITASMGGVSQSTSDTDSDLLFSVGGSVLLDAGSSVQLALTPGATISEGDTVFFVSAALLFPRD